MKTNQITAEEFEKRFDEGEDIMKYADLSTARRPNRDKKMVKAELPLWMVDSLDKEAKRAKVSRQAMIKRLLEGQLRKVSV